MWYFYLEYYLQACNVFLSTLSCAYLVILFIIFAQFFVGIVVEDSLVLLLNLLKNNVSNQNFFKEGSYIQRLVPLFEMPLAEDGQKETQGWSAQRVTNFTLLLQVIKKKLLFLHVC